MLTDKKRTPENFHKRAENIRALVKSNVAFGELNKFFQEILSREREEYEGVTADDYLRGRISMIKDIIKIIDGE